MKLRAAKVILLYQKIFTSISRDLLLSYEQVVNSFPTARPLLVELLCTKIKYQIKWNKMSSTYFKYVILKKLKHFKLNNKIKSNHLWLSTLYILVRQLKNTCQYCILLMAGTKLWWFKVFGLLRYTFSHWQLPS